MWHIDQFDYTLPSELIAQTPAVPRDSSRLLVIDRHTGTLQHKHFFDLPQFLGPNDVLVRNNTKVIPARIFGKKETGGACEILLIREVALTPRSVSWECLTKPGLKVDQRVFFAAAANQTPFSATCTEITGYTRILEFNLNKTDFSVALNSVGHTPLPPYIHWADNDEEHLRQLYQTTYAKIAGSAAAPTAGLHFTPELDNALRDKGVQIEEITLHVGLGTFLPVQQEQIDAKQLHHEVVQITAETAAHLNTAKETGKRIVAVGTTTTRTLESFTNESGEVLATSSETQLFIQPGYKYKTVGGLITNFHLPKSSLLMLISAFVSKPNTSAEFHDFASSLVGKAYQTAIQEQYRFFSFGDGMFLQ